MANPLGVRADGRKRVHWRPEEWEKVGAEIFHVMRVDEVPRNRAFVIAQQNLVQRGELKAERVRPMGVAGWPSVSGKSSQPHVAVPPLEAAMLKAQQEWEANPEPPRASALIQNLQEQLRNVEQKISTQEGLRIGEVPAAEPEPVAKEDPPPGRVQPEAPAIAPLGDLFRAIEARIAEGAIRVLKRVFIGILTDPEIAAALLTLAPEEPPSAPVAPSANEPEVEPPAPATSPISVAPRPPKHNPNPPPSGPRMYRPRILVLGLREQQAALVVREFEERARVANYPPMQHKSRGFAEALKAADLVVACIDRIGHDYVEMAQANAPRIMRYTGGTGGLSKLIDEQLKGGFLANLAAQAA